MAYTIEIDLKRGRGSGNTMMKVVATSLESEFTLVCGKEVETHGVP